MKIYHNPRCSKSRQTLALLRERGFDPTIVLYLDHPPQENELKDLLNKLDMTAAELLRSSEPACRTLGLNGPDVTSEQIIQAMVANPVLIQRPVVVHENRARIGRPPEAVLEILA